MSFNLLLELIEDVGAKPKLVKCNFDTFSHEYTVGCSGVLAVEVISHYDVLSVSDTFHSDKQVMSYKWERSSDEHEVLIMWYRSCLTLPDCVKETKVRIYDEARAKQWQKRLLLWTVENLPAEVKDVNPFVDSIFPEVVAARDLYVKFWVVPDAST